MPTVSFEAGREIIIGASGLEAIIQNIGIIIKTLAYSVPLDRAFAGAGGFIDSPLPYVSARKIAELTEIIEAKEPRVTVEKIVFVADGDGAMDGRLYPVITFRVKE